MFASNCQLPLRSFDSKNFGRFVHALFAALGTTEKTSVQFDPEKLIPPPLDNSVCVECDARVPNEFHSCDAFMASLMGNPRLKSAPRPNRLAIDAFALQHPKRACKSAKSYAGHLAALCCGIEYSGSEKVHHAIQQWLSTSAEQLGLVRPEEPKLRGKLTVEHISQAVDSREFDERVCEWAMCVWSAYANQHELARLWVNAALNRKSLRA
jgi:hypothetical protein